MKAAWLSGQRIGLAIRWPMVPSPTLATCWINFVLGCPEFKSSATLVSQLVASCQFGFLVLLCYVWIICFYFFLI